MRETFLGKIQSEGNRSVLPQYNLSFVSLKTLQHEVQRATDAVSPGGTICVGECRSPPFCSLRVL